MTLNIQIVTLRKHLNIIKNLPTQILVMQTLILEWLHVKRILVSIKKLYKTIIHLLSKF